MRHLFLSDKSFLLFDISDIALSSMSARAFVVVLSRNLRLPENKTLLSQDSLAQLARISQNISTRFDVGIYIIVALTKTSVVWSLLKNSAKLFHGKQVCNLDQSSSSLYNL